MRSLLSVFILLLSSCGAVAKAPQGSDPSLPGVNTGALSAEQIKGLAQLFTQGACPCEPEKTLLDCVRASSCPGATELAGYGADLLREGKNPDEVAELVIRRYIEEFISFTFDLSKTPKKGAEAGRVVLVEFADFECPFCSGMREMVDGLLKAYPKDVTFYFKNYPISYHPQALPAARASLAAHAQGRFWEMFDLLYANQAKLDDQPYEALAEELGLDMKRFRADVASNEVEARIMADKKEAIDAQISGTPALFFNGKPYEGERTLEAMKAHVKRLLEAPVETKPAETKPAQ